MGVIGFAFERAGEDSLECAVVHAEVVQKEFIGSNKFVGHFIFCRLVFAACDWKARGQDCTRISDGVSGMKRGGQAGFLSMRQNAGFRMIFSKMMVFCGVPMRFCLAGFLPIRGKKVQNRGFLLMSHGDWIP